MAAEYTKQECLKLLKVAAQTFDKWLEETGIDARIDPADHRRKLLTRTQVEHLAYRYNRILPPDTPTKPADPLPALESRLRAYVKAELAALRTDLLARIEALEASPAPVQPTPSPIRAPTPSGHPTTSTARQTPISDPPARPFTSTSKPQRFTTLAGVQRFLRDHLDEPDLVQGWHTLPMTSGTKLLQLAQEQQAGLHPCTDRACVCHALLEA